MESQEQDSSADPGEGMPEALVAADVALGEDPEVTAAFQHLHEVQQRVADRKYKLPPKQMIAILALVCLLPMGMLLLFQYMG